MPNKMLSILTYAMLNAAKLDNLTVRTLKSKFNQQILFVTDLLTAQQVTPVLLSEWLRY